MILERKAILAIVRILCSCLDALGRIYLLSDCASGTLELSRLFTTFIFVHPIIAFVANVEAKEALRTIGHQGLMVLADFWDPMPSGFQTFIIVIIFLKYGPGCPPLLRKIASKLPQTHLMFYEWYRLIRPLACREGILLVRPPHILVDIQPVLNVDILVIPSNLAHLLVYRFHVSFHGLYLVGEAELILLNSISIRLVPLFYLFNSWHLTVL